MIADIVDHLQYLAFDAAQGFLNIANGSLQCKRRGHRLHREDLIVRCLDPAPIEVPDDLLTVSHGCVEPVVTVRRQGFVRPKQLQSPGGELEVLLVLAVGWVDLLCEGKAIGHQRSNPAVLRNAPHKVRESTHGRRRTLRNDPSVDNCNLESLFP